MVGVLDILRDRGYVHADEDSLARAVAELLPAVNPATPLSAAEQQFMAENSGISSHPSAVTDAVERLAARRIAQLAQTMDTEAVAAMLGVHRTRVQHLLERGDLFAYRDGRRNRFPAWQFAANGRPLPGLRAVLAALHPAHRSVVTGFMTTRHPELTWGQGPETVLDWLASDGDPQRAADLARGIHEPW